MIWMIDPFAWAALWHFEDTFVVQRQQQFVHVMHN